MLKKFKVRFTRKNKITGKVFPSKVVTVEADDKHHAYGIVQRYYEHSFPQCGFLIWSIRDESGCYVCMID